MRFYYFEFIKYILSCVSFLSVNFWDPLNCYAAIEVEVDKENGNVYLIDFEMGHERSGDREVHRTNILLLVKLVKIKSSMFIGSLLKKIFFATYVFITWRLFTAVGEMKRPKKSRSGHSLHKN